MSDNHTRAEGVVDVGAFVETNEAPGQLKPRKWIPVRVLGQLGGLLVLVLALFTTATVILRFLDLGVVGAVELASLSMVLVTVLVIPAVTAADENFRVELIDFFATEEVVHRLNIFALIVQLLVTAFITFSALDLFIHDVDTRTTMAGELYLQRSWMTGIVLVGFIGVLYATVVNFIRTLRGSTIDKSEV